MSTMSKHPVPDFKLRLEFVGKNPDNVSGKSSKYWQCEVYQTHLIRRWGKIGTRGQTKGEIFPTQAAAQAAALKLASEKQRGGYTLEVDIITLIGSLADSLDEHAA